MNRYAVCVGIDLYGQGNGTPGTGPGTRNYLPGAVRTSRGMAILLAAKGFRTTELYDTAATKAAIAAALQEMYRLCQGQGDQMVYQHTGHGLDLYGQACLVPIDALPADGSSQTQNLIPRNQWQALIAQRPPHGHLFTNLDVCYAEGLDTTLPGVPQSAKTDSQWPHPITPFGTPNAPDTQDPPVHTAATTNNLVEYSPCRDNEVSVEMMFGGQEYALWTYEILRALQTPFATHATYQTMYATAKAAAQTQYAGANPVLAGDPAMYNKTFLT